MTQFPAPPTDDYAAVYMDDTDRPLPETLNQRTRYAYFKTIARGGKCVIKTVKDLHLSRVVCYKTLKPELADDPLEQKRFLREARVSAMLQHPNTVPMYELGRDARGHYYFTMKLVHGYTLREVLDYRDRYDLTQLVKVIVQVAYALEYAHSHRVVHRDVKPENILVGPFGEVLLLDWGLAKVWHPDGTSTEVDDDGVEDTDAAPLTITGQGKLQGTIAYMSPEQIREDPNIDYRTDLYSLGVVLYEVLCGQTPGVGDTVHDLIDQITEVVPARPSERTNDVVPELLESLAMQCIQKVPADRIQSAGALIRMLQEDWAEDLATEVLGPPEG